MNKIAILYRISLFQNLYTRFIMILFITLAILINLANALIGFDCGGPNLNHTTISLLDIEECAPVTTAANTTQVHLQLLQLSEYGHTEIMQCRVKISRNIYYCGMHSHISAVNNGQAEYLLEVSYSKCLQMHQDHAFTIANGLLIDGLKTNNTMYRAVTIAGQISTDGTCTGAQYSDPYGTWDKVVVQAVLEINLRHGFAPVQLDTGKITLPSGTTCELLKGTCIDLDEGYTFWRPMPFDSCNFNRYDVLYEGPAVKVQDTTDDAPVVYSLTTDDITFALTKTSEQPICGYTLLRTEHPKLFIFEMKQGNPIIRKNPISVDNLDIFAYVNSKFVYVEKHVRNQMTALYNNVMQQKCRLEKRVLKNALSLASFSPDDFAYTIMKTPGYMSVVAGEVAHIIRCVPIEVKLRRTEVCYNELPVTYRNQSFFLSPKSRILARHGTVRECNTMLPVIYRIEDTWIKFLPIPTETTAPDTLKPLSLPNWKYKSPGPLATSGIYTEHDVEKLRDHIMFPAEKPAVLNTIARGMSGHSIPPGTVSLNGLLDEDAVNKIAESAASRIWSGFITFGSASAGILSIFIIFRFVKLVLDTIVHGYTLHSVYGCSLHILGALWSSITHLLIHLASPKPDNKNEQQKQPPADEEAPLAGSASAPPAPQPAERNFITTQPVSYTELRERIDNIVV